jgi:hypothetical protein
MTILYIILLSIVGVWLISSTIAFLLIKREVRNLSWGKGNTSDMIYASLIAGPLLVITVLVSGYHKLTQKEEK